ncbi:MAG: pyruvate, phosphate dikinase [Proteobacteria bacterium]|nr:pyruvate, phosphate dikinase [Pseudomonadota bacterium]
MALLAVAAMVACKTASVDPPRPGKVIDAAVTPDAAAAPALPAAAELAPVVVPVTAPPRKLWTAKLEDEATFLAYSKQLGNERFGKFVIDLKSDAIYYFDVDVYAVHKDFIFQELYKKPKTKAAVRVFDKNYTAQKTDFMMCYLVHHLSQDAWTFAFWDGDTATAAHVTHAYKRMKETFFLGDRVKFRPDSDHQEAVARQLVDVPFILNDTLYQAATYVAFNKGAAIGTLRQVPPGIEESELTFAPDEIVILKTPLADITPVAGIISETFSTPLAHVSLRARGWGIPNIGLKAASTTLAALVGKTVFFEATDASYTLRAATEAEIAAHAAMAKTARAVKLPIAALDVARLAPLEELTARDVVAYGAKAANLGEIIHAKADGINVPAGFGVPFRYYAEHLKAAKLDERIAAMLAEPRFATDSSYRKAKLAELRKAIVDAPASPDLVAQVAAALATLTADDATVGVFVRSSGNAEDLEDFSGAGLYDTVPNMKGTDATVGAIKTVWASIWNLGAYDNRKLYNIDEAQVFSGVLVQIGVAATAAGVLVTVHPTDPTDEKNYTVNAKSGLGMAVVDGRKVPESLIVSWYNHGIRVLSRSSEDTKLVFDERGGIHEVPNPDKGKPVLTNQMAITLVDAARRITKIFKSNKLDIEWVFAGTVLHIVQTRPYLVK